MSDFRYYGTGNGKPNLTEVFCGVGLIAVDIETHSISDPIPVGIGIAWTPTDAVYFSLLPPSQDIPWHMLRDPAITKVMHNAPFDLRGLREWDVDTTNVIDTAVMARMAVVPGNLEDACEVMETIHRPRHMKDVWDELGVDNSIDMPDDDIALKCCTDCLGTLELYYKLEPMVDMDYVRHEMKLLPILEAMSRRGIAIDQGVRYGLEVIYESRLNALQELCMDMYGFNPNSPTQVAYILSKRGNFLPLKRSVTGRWSMTTDEATLEKIMHVEPLAGLVLEARHVQKMLGTYIRPLEGQERAYTFFHLDAATARISSSSWDHRYERNLQNIPTDYTGQVSMRNMFVPDSGTFTDTDFSQIELRVLAHMSDDRVMQDILNDPAGDIHQETANFLGIPRKIAKNCTFAVTYGATAETVAETAHIQDLRMAQRMLDMIFHKYRRMGDWIRSTQEFGRVHGYVMSMKGRKVSVQGPDSTPLPEDDVKTVTRKLAARDRKSCNYPIQMSAGEIMKDAELISWEEIWEARGIPMANQIHDEIIWDGYAGTKEEISEMFNGKVAPFPTPVSTKYLERWE